MNDFPVYQHGFSVRVKLLLDPVDAAKALAKCGWQSDGKQGGWIRDSETRQHIRGTAWLTGRAPRNQRLPLAKKNKEWQTKLYGLGVDHGPDGSYLDLSGVRIGDIDRFCRSALQLHPEQLSVDYFRAAEWYVCLAPAEANRLADSLHVRPSNDRAKSFLVRDYPIPVTVRARTRMTARLNCYRVNRGCTADFRLELRLVGKRERRQTFGAADVATLKDILTGLISTHDLHPHPKPVRWEPRDFHDPREACPMDPILERLPLSAVKGKALDEAWIGKCHTLPTPKLLSPPPGCKGISPSGRIRMSESVPPSSDGGEKDSLLDVKDDHPPSLWDDLADDLLSQTGHLVEVVLDPDQDPSPLLQAIASRAATMVRGLSDSSTWRGVEEAILGSDEGEEADTMVVVVDPGSLPYRGLVDFDETTGTLDRAAFPANWNPEWGFLPVQCRAMAGQLWELMKGLRECCERDGCRIAVVSVDARSDHGKTGTLRKSDFFRDARVRSTLGDAGRYWAHIRLRVEDGRVVLWKDEVDGRAGRVAWDQSWGGLTAGRSPAVEDDIDVDGLVDRVVHVDDDSSDYGDDDGGDDAVSWQDELTGR